MLFIPPTLEKELKKQKRVFSIVIRPSDSDSSTLLLIREALIISVNNRVAFVSRNNIVLSMCIFPNRNISIFT